MIELSYISPPPARPAWEPRVLSRQELAPDERVRLESTRDSVLSVIDGVVYAVVDDEDYVLMPGDRIEITAGEPFRVWNAGDEVARVVTERG
jgi:mannose-6-phosphate isomerase-like protein (cupin superfamily)